MTTNTMIFGGAVRRLRVGSTASMLAHATPHAVLPVSANDASSAHE